MKQQEVMLMKGNEALAHACHPLWCRCVFRLSYYPAD